MASRDGSHVHRATQRMGGIALQRRHLAGDDKKKGSGIMQFTKSLRERVRTGEVTCSIRIWQRPRVTVGRSYSRSPGRIVVDKLKEIGLSDITPELPRRSGFTGGRAGRRSGLGEPQPTRDSAAHSPATLVFRLAPACTS